jgi:hypothetical protein
VNLAKWAGIGKRKIGRTEAINILAEVRGAVLKREFRIEGKVALANAVVMTFGKFLDLYQTEEVEKRGLTNKALPAFIKAIRAEFGEEPFDAVSTSAERIEGWMERLREREVPLSHTTTATRKVTWSPRTWNAYRTMGCDSSTGQNTPSGS